MMSVRALILDIAVGLAGGWFGADLFYGALDAKELRHETKQSAINVSQAAASSERIETAVAATDSNVTEIKAAVVKRGVTLQPRQEKPHAAPG